MKTRLSMFAGALICVSAMAQEPRGTIVAEPNSCMIERGRHECTVTLSWHTEGVRAAKVFVTGEGKHPAQQRIFSDSRNCEPGSCRADWIEDRTQYRFDLVDFSRGDRGQVLATTTVTGHFGEGDPRSGMAGERGGFAPPPDARGAEMGQLTAEPNPCRIERGQHRCTVSLAWHSQGTAAAKVMVQAEGQHPSPERVFSDSRNCQPGNCKADWIEPNTRYEFRLYDFSSGNRGQMLGSVVVTANVDR